MRIELGGFSLHYELAGNAAETITCLHGLAANLHTWKRQVDALSPRYRVLTWDLRAHGRSEAPDGPYTLGDLSHDLFLLLQGLSLPPTYLLGHSAGGVVAMHFALNYPEMVRGLILVGAASACNERAARWYEDLAQTAERDGGAAVLKRVGLNHESDIPPDPVGFAKISRCMGGLHQAPLTGELEKISCPTLVMVGEKDFIGVGGPVILHRHIPGSRLEIVKDRGHAIHLEDPEGFNQLILGFLP